LKPISAAFTAHDGRHGKKTRVEIGMTLKNDSHANQELTQTEGRREQTNLDCRYREIGILAVAAAVRYAGGGKNPAYAPVVPQPDERFSEFAT